MWWTVLGGAAISWAGCFVVLKGVEAVVGGERLGCVLERWGVSVGLAYVSWRTTALNAPLARAGSGGRAVMQRWYGAGAACGVLCMAASVAVLALNLVMLLLHLFGPAESASQPQMLTPVVCTPSPLC